MNYKKVNWSFLGMVLIHLLVVFALVIFGSNYTMGIVTNLFVSELLLVIPAFITLLCSREAPNRVLGFHRLKISSVLMIFLYTALMSPLTTLLNAISMLFVENEVSSMSGEVVEVPFLLMFFMMAIFGPVCEELCFRGIVYRGYLKSGNALGAVLLSSLLFGLIHMNFNQAPYAFVLGVAMALLVEATGSLFSSILMHATFNGWSVVVMYVYDRFLPGMTEQVEQSAGTEEMIAVISLYFVLALVCTALAGCVLVWLCMNQGRGEYVAWLWRQRKERKGKGKLVSVPLVIGITLCLALMFLMV